MQKRNSTEPGSHNQAEAPRRPHLLILILFWPFFLLNFLVRSLHTGVKWLAYGIGYPLVTFLSCLSILAAIYIPRAQTYDIMRIHAMPQRTIVLDRMGKEIGRIHGEKRFIVPLGEVSDHFRKAILAREDERFYNHGAVDPIGIIRAAINNTKGKREGASTLTQQLVSDIFQLKRGEKRGDTLRQLDRKCLEIAIAFRLEGAFDKDEILEAYINQINWGRQIKGIGEASRIYFEKHPSELTLSQSALLAGIVRGPDSFNPFRSLDASTRERNTTLERMVAANVITRADADTAKLEPIKVRPEWRRSFKESSAMDAIRQDLEMILEKQDIELGGLEIITTIDLRVQEAAEQAIKQKLLQVEALPGYQHQTLKTWHSLPEEQRPEPKYIQAATVVFENQTGAIVAIVGGRDANESRFNRATDGKRQIGSLFKPFVYMAAIDKGLKPDSLISDDRIEPGEIKGGGSWRPKNSDDTYGGMMPISYGLIRSRNTMSVRIGNYAGISKVSQLATDVGFMTEMPKKPSAFLGSWEATPWELSAAYSIFPNEGTRYIPYLISQIRDRDGNELFSTQPLSRRATSAKSTIALSTILQEVTRSGTAATVQKLGFDQPCGGKTGTTNDFKDAWFAGYTSSLTCSVWVGLDTPKRIMQGGYGSILALPIWVDIMKQADQFGYKCLNLHDKTNTVQLDICQHSGLRATTGCKASGCQVRRSMNAAAAPNPDQFCPLHPPQAIAILIPDPSERMVKPAPVLIKPSSAPPQLVTPANKRPVPLLQAIPIEDEEIPIAIPADDESP